MPDGDRAVRIWSVGMDLRAMERAQARREARLVEAAERQAERRRYGAVVDDDPDHDTLDWADR